MRAWPVTLREDPGPPARFSSLLLRPLRRNEQADWDRVRGVNTAWLAPWEPSDPALERPDKIEPWTRPSFGSYVRSLNRQARSGHSVPWVIEVDGELAGQVTAGSMVYASQRSAVVGYWVSHHLAGRGIAPLALAMMIDYLLAERALHRVEICIRPENEASIRVVQKLGLRYEGVRPRFIHINGQWSDHLVYALDTSEWNGPGTLVARWYEWLRTGSDS
ncbi:ribosomal-protein-alanine N-acetyltransferase [Micrococcales bacterium KH10]|nr:ribosomal-protein-alanine N-acetyltransferase [Micrococcales bacterium KH10]